MQKLYEGFFKSSKLFDQFIQEQKWKNLKNKMEFKVLIDNEYSFWKRVLSFLPPEKRLIKEFEWFTNCYNQIHKNLTDEPINLKMRWLSDGKDSL
jgi:hypothetical protein